MEWEWRQQSDAQREKLKQQLEDTPDPGFKPLKAVYWANVAPSFCRGFTWTQPFCWFLYGSQSKWDNCQTPSLVLHRGVKLATNAAKHGSMCLIRAGTQSEALTGGGWGEETLGSYNCSACFTSWSPNRSRSPPPLAGQTVPMWDDNLSRCRCPHLRGQQRFCCWLQQPKLWCVWGASAGVYVSVTN